MNTDEPERLRKIMAAFNQVSETIILPVHPRTRKALSNINVHLEDHIQIIEPVGYFDMLIFGRKRALDCHRFWWGAARGLLYESALSYPAR